MDVASFYAGMLFLLSVGGLSVFFTGSQPKKTNYIAHGMAGLGCLAVILCAVFILLGQKFMFTLFLPAGNPFGNVTFAIDRLSAYFLLITGVVGLAGSVYAIGYSREYYGYRLNSMAAWYNVFLLSMVLVLTVSHVAAFVIFWEIMVLSSFFLVSHDYEKPAVMRASYTYLVMTHVGTVFVITAFLLLAAATGSMDFSHLSGAGVSDSTKNIVFICALIGFGSKAGMIPLHIWLPQAYPVAPTHVSVLMSAVMFNTAVYGLCRFFLSFLGMGPVWWGWTILALAVVSAVLGSLYALMERDMKRLLAYSSIENMGIILLGMGAGMVFMSSHQPVLAGLAWCAALYHVFNHALFKALLFMGAGAVLQAAQTRDMERLGGLIKVMPYTAVFFLAAVMAIAALPPLNGFISEWLTLQSLFLLPVVAGGIGGKIFAVVFIALAGLTGALAAASFVKLYGMVFLGRPRTAEAEEAEEAPRIMLWPMGLLGGLCVLAGVWPQLLLTVLGQVLADFSSLVDTRALFAYQWHAVAFHVGSLTGTLSTLGVITLLSGGAFLAVLLYRLHGRPKVTIGETWTCGIVPTSRMEYSATGFSKPFQRLFAMLLRSQQEVLAEGAGTEHERQYFGRRLSFRVDIKDIFGDALYRPANAWLIKLALLMKAMQTGSVQLYIGYITVVMIIVLVYSLR